MAPILRVFLLVVFYFFLAGHGWGHTVVVNPLSPWAVPANVTSIQVEVWGGGGGAHKTYTGLTAGTCYPRVKDANGCESPSCP